MLFRAQAASGPKLVLAYLFAGGTLRLVLPCCAPEIGVQLLDISRSRGPQAAVCRRVAHYHPNRQHESNESERGRFKKPSVIM
ncbi:hypothetical protein FJTKL_10859 [Diaporthe vaccinii]|uniref:Secreted protein n=1 Tax=Diaporthe vaccinii TaxID=105482 RepID=A0ABR4FC32_9PEZI